MPKRSNAPPALKRAAVAGVTVVVAVLAWAAPAYAHHPEVAGEVVCATNNQLIVNWTVSHNEGGSGRSMRIERVVVTQGTVNLDVGQVLPPKDLPGSTVKAVTVLPGDATGSVTLAILGRWLDPDGTETDILEWNETTVELPGQCATPAVPAATIVANCIEGGALVTLTNTGGSATTFDVLKGTTKIDTVEVAPGGTVTRTYPMTEDETATFRAVTPEGFDTGAVPVTYNCLAAPPPAVPTATIVANCTTGGALVTLINTGGTATTFDVLKGTTKIETLEVVPGQTVTRTYPMTEDETATFRAVTAEGFDTGAVPVTYNCLAAPAPVVPTAVAAEVATEVKGVVLTQPPVVASVAPAPTATVTTVSPQVAGVPLAKTGVETTPLVSLGLALVGVGLALTLSSSRTNSRPVTAIGASTAPLTRGWARVLTTGNSLSTPRLRLCRAANRRRFGG